MDRERTSEETPFEAGAVDAWLREALEPEPGTAERLAAGAVGKEHERAAPSGPGSGARRRPSSWGPPSRGRSCC